MGTPATKGAVTITSSPIPALLAAAGYTGTVIAAVSFSITNGIATISLGANNLPTNGYNGPNGYPANNGTTHARFDIYGGVSGQNNAGGNNRGGGAAGGQQVVLWGFTTATYFNGKIVTVLDNHPLAGTFRFYFNHANVASTNDAGNTAPIPVEAYRAIRIECGQSNGTDFVYVGDLNVSSSRYIAALSLTGQVAVEISSDNLRADRIMLASTSTSDTAQISVTY